MLARLRFTREIALLAVLVSLGTGTACSVDAGLSDAGPADAAPDDNDIMVALAAIEGATVYEEFSFTANYRRFRISFEQPVDHADPDGPRFTQMLTLLHRDVTAPMVLVSTGYHDFLLGALAEPTVLLQANQVVVEHRYYGESRPRPPDWSRLDIEQAAGDHHRVVKALQPLYTGRWLSTGSSKGGMTSIFHRRFHPDDVTATIAYVAPINYSADDVRYEAFFDQLGQSVDAGDCVQRVRNLQRQALIRRTELMGYLAEMAMDMGYTFQRAGGLEPAFEMGVVELEWTFWQYQSPSACNTVPPDTATIDLIAEFLDASRVVWTMSDQEAGLFEAYYYQALTQIGYPSVPYAHLGDLLQFDYEGGLALLAPDGVVPTYDAEAMRDVADWLASEGERIILIYGARDPWSAGAMALGNAVDSYSFMAPDASHDAKLGKLTFEDSEQAIALLRAWAEVPGASASHQDPATAALPSQATQMPGPPGEGAPLRPRLGL
jgi:PS-10 peptidase S37